MATFVSLINFTQRGEEDIQHSVDRANAFCAAAEKVGARVKDVYWTLGKVDGVLVFEAPSDEVATSLMLGLAHQGNVRTQTLRAFTSEEMSAIVSSLA